MSRDNNVTATLVIQVGKMIQADTTAAALDELERMVVDRYGPLGAACLREISIGYIHEGADGIHRTKVETFPSIDEGRRMIAALDRARTVGLDPTIDELPHLAVEPGNPVDIATRLKDQKPAELAAALEASGILPRGVRVAASRVPGPIGHQLLAAYHIMRESREKEMIERGRIQIEGGANVYRARRQAGMDHHQAIEGIPNPEQIAAIADQIATDAQICSTCGLRYDHHDGTEQHRFS